jgi:8-hydroxy-5-deazaflavin:NADPH oxidoreductase
MKIGILGTGMVGETLGTKLVQLEQSVTMGSRTPNNEKALAWVEKTGSNAFAGTFADAAKFGEILFNCTSGAASLEALKLVGAENMRGKILIDVANPLDFSKGMPPTLTVSNNDSLGEQIQRAYPEVKVVKALNTLTSLIMVNPQSLAGGDHDLFICGNDAEAKKTVTAILVSFGWKAEHIYDLGDITNARGTESLLPLWIRLMGKFQSPMFQWKVVR